MTDLDFDYLYVPNRYPDVVQRSAVLYPLTKRCGSTNQIRYHTAKLVEMWRARVGVLSANGWRPRLNSNSLTFTRNCCPTFVYARPRNRSCKSRACPFCYARDVRDLWELVDKQFLRRRVSEGENLPIDDSPYHDDMAIDDVDESVPAPYHLVERVHRFYWPYLTPAAQEAGDTRQTFLRRILQALPQIRAKDASASEALGAYLGITIEPSPKGWRICYRQLFKVSAGLPFPDEIAKATNGRFIRHAHPTRKTIVKAVARTMRYPIRLMFGDAELTAELLTIMQEERVRMDAVYGSFRGRRS